MRLALFVSGMWIETKLYPSVMLRLSRTLYLCGTMKTLRIFPGRFYFYPASGLAFSVTFKRPSSEKMTVCLVPSSNWIPASNRYSPALSESAERVNAPVTLTRSIPSCAVKSPVPPVTPIGSGAAVKKYASPS